MRRVVSFIVIAVLLGACTIETGDGEPIADAADVQDPLDEVVEVIDEVADEAQDGGGAEATDEVTAGVSEPVVRVPENTGQVEATNWLARTYMDAESVELVWSPVEGASDYRLYRIPTSAADYDAIGEGNFDGAEQVFAGDEYGFIDDDPPTGTFLTYFVVAEVDGARTEARWAEALTVEDTTPPTPITGLSASVSADGVLLEWDSSSDDVEFAAYNVSLLTDEGTAQYLGGGADESQTAFLDTNPLSGENRYVVTAADFHNNVSEAAEITVEVG